MPTHLATCGIEWHFILLLHTGAGAFVFKFVAPVKQFEKQWSHTPDKPDGVGQSATNFCLAAALSPAQYTYIHLLIGDTHAPLLCCSCDYLPKLDKYKCVKRKSPENVFATRDSLVVSKALWGNGKFKVCILLNSQTLWLWLGRKVSFWLTRVWDVCQLPVTSFHMLVEGGLGRNTWFCSLSWQPNGEALNLATTAEMGSKKETIEPMR